MVAAAWPECGVSIRILRKGGCGVLFHRNAVGVSRAIAAVYFLRLSTTAEIMRVPINGNVNVVNSGMTGNVSTR